MCPNERFSLRLLGYRIDNVKEILVGIDKKKLKEENSERLQNEYERLVEGLRQVEQDRANDETLANPGKEHMYLILQSLSILCEIR
uniref:DNA 5'-3' helicase n=1 Tax=Parascaris equorum TaxID=6256 RepID=A0A914R9K5_PAREQ